jgi:hypothetical protein
LVLGAKPTRETFHSSLEISREALMGLGLSPDRVYSDSSVMMKNC